MSKVFTSNIFFTTNIEIANKFRQQKSYSLFLQSLNIQEKDQVLTTSNGRNSGLLEFNFNFGKAQSANQNFVVVKFMDTNSSFEKFFIESNIIDDIKGLSVNPKEPIGIKEVFFSFGVGDNLENWSGPFVSKLINSSYAITSGGLRVVTLNLVPILGKMIENYYVKNRVVSNRIDAAPRISQQTYTIVKSISQIFKPTKFFDPNFIDDTINQVVSGYLKNISQTENVLVLFPSVQECTNQLVKNFIFPERRFHIDQFWGELGFKSYSVLNSKIASILEINDLNPAAFQDALESSPNWALDVEYVVELSNPQPKPDKYPEYFSPLNEVTKKLQKLFTKVGTIFQPTLFVENNLKIVKLLHDNGLVKDANKSVTIYGDLELINQLIYCVHALRKQDIDNLTYKNRNITLPNYINEGKFSKFRSSFFENILAKNALNSLETDVLALNKSDDRIVDFKYNLPNSNILSINIESFPGVLARMNNIYVNNRLQSIIVDGAREFIKKIKPVKDKAKLLYSKLRKIIPGLAPQPATDAQTTQASLDNQKGKVATGVQSAIKVVSDTQAATMERQILEELNKLYLQVSIRTLPFFNLTNLMTRCRVTSKNLELVGNKKIRDVGAIIDGDFVVVSFSHTITASDSYSEFTLTRTTPTTTE